MNDNEEKAILACQKGNLEEFALLYDAYFPKLYRFCYFKTSHRETAEDLTSQTFFKALKKINSFKAEKGTFQAWLFQIARNTVIDYYRQSKTTINIDGLFHLTDGSEPAKRAENNQLLEKAKQLLVELSPQHQEIIVLRIWQGLKHKEIAQILNISEANSKVAFSRAIKKIKHHFAAETGSL